MFVASYTKNKEGIFTSIDREYTELFEREPYTEDMQWGLRDALPNLTKPVHDAFVDIQQRMAKYEKPISTSACIVTPYGPYHFTTHRKPLRNGGFIAREFVINPIHYYQGWPLLLNHHIKVLHLPNGKNLTRKDLSTLNLFAQGLPRKMIAKGTETTVKSVEKRLAKIKDILTPENEISHSLNICLKDLNLVPFILAEFDWFDPIEWMQEHIAHAN